MKRCLIAIAGILMCLAGFAQLPSGNWVRVDDGDLVISPFNIQDIYTRQRFTEDAEVSIYKSDSTTLLTKQVWYGGNTVNGVREIDKAYARIPLLRRIVIKVEKEGYETLVQAVDLPDVKKLKKRKDGKYHWNGLKKMFIRRSIMSKQLGEAQVTASRLQMVVKGDTLEYNVANLQLSAGSMLDNLIRNLPGAQLSPNGRITVNGEFVQKLLVNGRQFFNGDALVALRNLPYYTVGKIKVFHDIGTFFTSKADSLNRLNQTALTMDVRLKKIYSEMWLANFEVGAGTRTHTDWDNVYFGRFFAMRFTDHSSIGIYGVANNVGKNYSATHAGNWREMTAFDGGEPETQSGGIDFSVDGKKTKVKFKTTFNAARERNVTENRISEQEYLTTGDLFRRNRFTDTNRSLDIKWNAGISKNAAGYDFSITPQLHYTYGRGRSESRSALFDDEPMDASRTASLDSIFGLFPSARLMDLLINSRYGMGQNKNSWFNGGIDFQGSLKFPRARKQLSLSASTGYQKSTRKDIYLSKVHTASDDYNENNFTEAPNRRFHYSAAVSYPVFYYSHKKMGVSGNLNYGINHCYSKDERTLYKDNADWSNVPDMNTGYAWEYDLRNSYLTDQWADDHLLTWSMQVYLPGLKKDRDINLSLDLPFHADIHKVADHRNSNNRHLRKKFCYLTPSFRFSALNYALGGGYELKTSVPMLNDMLDIYDDAFSLYRTLGNPNLKPAHTHNFNLKWRKNKREKARWINLSLQHEIMKRHITPSRIYNRETGVTISRMDNINGNWWSSARAAFGSALDEAKRFNLSANVFYTYANSVAYSGYTQVETPQRLTVYNNRTGANASVSYAKGERRVSLSGSATWNGLTSQASSFRSMSYVNMNYTLSLTTPLIRCIEFDTDLNLKMRRGYHEPSMNTTEWVWNASLSAKAGRSGQWVLRLIAFDILHNLSNVTNTVDAQGHREWWRNGVQSYASFHITYHIKVKPSKKGMEGKTPKTIFVSGQPSSPHTVIYAPSECADALKQQRRQALSDVRSEQAWRRCR